MAPAKNEDKRIYEF